MYIKKYIVFSLNVLQSRHSGGIANFEAQSVLEVSICISMEICVFCWIGTSIALYRVQSEMKN